MTKEQEYQELVISEISLEKMEMLMAELIALGYEGFVEEEQLLSAYILSTEFSDSEVREVCERYQVSWQVKTVVNKNWNELWESSFTPVKLENFCEVRAEFHQPDPSVLYDIVITPKMSFGTGHHATTFLMIEALSRQNLQEKAVLDFGTGTGVLAILAEKMGAVRVLAIDNDEWSIENGTENIEKNGCSRVSILLSDHLEAGQNFDLILANITRNVIIDHLKSIATALNPGGIVLLSGFLVEDFEVIKNALIENSLTLSTYRERNGWVCMEAMR